MPYYRVSYEYYVEGEYSDKEEAENDLLEDITDIERSDLTVETFNETTKEWE